MENASKAIIIAGAIMLTIIVSTIVIIFFNRSAESTIQISKSYEEADIQNHNAQFSIYEGNGRKKTEIDKLVSVVNSNNKRVKDSNFIVTLTGSVGGSVATGFTFSGNNINASGNIIKYRVSVTYDSNGIINEINVS